MALDPIPFPADSAVKYDDRVSNGGLDVTNWMLPSYDDSAWPTGWAYLVNNDVYPSNNNGYLHNANGQTLTTYDRWLGNGPPGGAGVGQAMSQWTHTTKGGNGTSVIARARFTVNVAGTYGVCFIADNSGSAYLDGAHLIDGAGSPSYTGKGTVYLSAGSHLIAWQGTGDGVTDLAVVCIYDPNAGTAQSGWSVGSVRGL